MEIPDELRRKIRKLASAEKFEPAEDNLPDEKIWPETVVVVLLVINE